MAVRNAMQAMEDTRQACLIGIPTAGTPLAQAGARESLIDNHPFVNQDDKRVICHRLMREFIKDHGAHQTWVNGEPDPAKHCYWLVDNVATNGVSKLEAMEKLRADGYPSIEEIPVLVFVDRQQGAVQRLETAGFKKIVVVYNLLDITFALGELYLWPKEAVKGVEEEIKAHQFQ